MRQPPSFPRAASRFALCLILCLSALSLTTDLGVADVHAQAPAPVPGPESLPAAVTRSEITTRATGRAASPGVHLVRFELPEDAQLGAESWSSTTRLIVHGDQHGVAVLERDDQDYHSLPTGVVVRLVGARAPSTLTVTLATTSEEAVHHREPGRAVTVRVEGIAAAPQDPMLSRRFLALASGWFDRDATLGGHAQLGFHAYAVGRLRALAEGGPLAAAAPAQQRAQRGDLMSLFTGMTSVNEALQADRGLALRSEAKAAYTTPLADVTPVPMAAHPWPEMIAELGEAPVIEPLAKAAPVDKLYVHFHDLRDMVKVARLVDEHLGPLALAGERSAGAARYLDGYERQLVLERTALSEHFGHVVARGVAFVVGDPFLRDGTDVSLLYRVNDRATLLAALEGFEDNARARRPDATVTTYEIDGHAVRLLSTPDGALRQHRVELGDVLALSNSRAAIASLIAVHEGQAPSLADAGDFQYMRTRYPADADAEVGFVFVSDAFVAHSVSPRVKILQARRMQARADLLALNHAALLHGWLEGGRPASAQALVDAGMVAPSELVHADGTPILFDPARGARSERWGRAAALTPIADLEVSAVSAAEAQAYDAFRETYQTYWRTFIDPIGARLALSDDGQTLSVDARILPLIAGTSYSDVLELVGERGYHVHASGDTLELITALSGAPEARERFASEFVLDDLIADPSLAWLGDWALLGLAEHPGFPDLIRDLAGGPGPITPNRGRGGWDGLLEAFLASPLYAAVHVSDPAAVSAKLAQGTFFKLPSNLRWRQAPGRAGVIIHTLEGEVWAQATTELVHVALAGDVLLFATQQPVLEAQIARVRAGHVPRSAGDAAWAPGVAQSGLELNPTAGSELERFLALGVEYGAEPACHMAAFAYEALARGLVTLPTDAEARRALSLDYLGFEPACAHGGALSLDPLGLPVVSAYGHLLAPQPFTLPVASSALSDAIGGVERLGAHLSVEGEGSHQGLRVQLWWTRR